MNASEDISILSRQMYAAIEKGHERIEEEREKDNPDQEVLRRLYMREMYDAMLMQSAQSIGPDGGMLPF